MVGAILEVILMGGIEDYVDFSKKTQRQHVGLKSTKSSHRKVLRTILSNFRKLRRVE